MLFEPLSDRGRQTGRTTRQLMWAIGVALGTDREPPRDVLFITHNQNMAKHLRERVRDIHPSPLLNDRLIITSCNGARLDDWRMVVKLNPNFDIYTEHQVWEMILRNERFDAPSFFELGLMNRDANIANGL